MNFKPYLMGCVMEFVSRAQAGAQQPRAVVPQNSVPRPAP